MTAITTIDITETAGSYGVGDTLTFVIDFDAAIDVVLNGGEVRIQLSNGAYAVYNGSDLTNVTQMTFVYVIAEGDMDEMTDLTVTGTSFDLQGGATVNDQGSPTAATLTNSGTVDDSGIFMVDANSPTGVVNHDAMGPLISGSTITFTVDMGETVSVGTGGDVPVLTLSNGDTAAYSTGASNPAAGALIFTYQVPTGSNEADLEVSGYTGIIEDLAGNAGVIDATTTLDIVTDTTAPGVTSITRGGANELSNAASVTFEVTFDGPVQNVDVADFQVSGLAGVTGVSLSGNVATVTVDTTTFVDGQLSLGFAPSSNIADAAGNSLNTTPTGTVETYTLDQTAPTVTSITRNTSSVELTNQNPVEFIVEFDSPVQNVDVGDFSVTNSGMILSATLNAAGTIATVLVSNAMDGVLSLSFAAGADITDIAGNPLDVTLPSGANYETYSIDRTAPILQSIERASSAAEVTNDGIVSFEVTFDSDVTNINANSFSVPSPASVTGFSLAGNVATVEVTVGSLADGPLELSLSSGQVILDLAGNGLNTTNPPTTVETYTIDNTAPVIATPVIAEAPVVNIVEASDGVEISVDVTGNPTSVSIGNVAAMNTSGDTWTATIAQANVADGTNNYDVVVTDAAGNSDTQSFSFEADLMAPNAPVITALTNDTGTDGTDALANVTSNGLSGTSDAPDGTLIRVYDAGNDQLVAQTTVSSNAWATTNIGMSANATTDYYAIAFDVNGNPSAQSSNFSVEVDTVAPNASISADQTGPLQVGEVITFTVDFDSDVFVGATAPELTLTGGRLATFVSAVDSDTLTFTYTVIDPDNEADLEVTGYTGDVTDAAGNAAVIAATTALNIELDTETPLVTAAALAGNVVENDTPLYTATGDIDFVDAPSTTTAPSVGVAPAGGGVGYIGLFQATLPDDSVGDGMGQLTWTFNVTNAAQQTAIQSLGEGETRVQSYTITLTDQDGNAFQEVVTITITGTNDTPVIAGGPASAALTEGAAGLSAMGTFAISDIDDLNTADLLSVNEGTAADVVVSGANGGLTNQQLLDMFSVTLDSQAQVTWDFNSGSEAFDFLAEGDTLSITFNVNVVDDSGDTASDTVTETVTVVITGTNDAAVITGATTVTALEDGAAVGSDLASTDVDGTADLFIAETVAGTYGSVSIDAAGVWSYTIDNANGDVDALDAGDVAGLTDSVTIQTADGTTQVLIINIDGANDAAVITGNAAATAVEDGTAAVGGNLDHTDVDGDDTDDVWTANVIAGAFGTLTIDAAGVWSYALDDGNAVVDALNAASAALTDTITVSTADGTTQDIVITINGANDAAIITGAAANGTDTVKEDSDGSATGQLFHTDVDTADADNFFTEITTPSVGTYGSLTMTSAGVWSYALNDADADTDALNDGEVVTDTFDVTSGDGTVQQIVITIEGTNDAALISGDFASSVIEAGVDASQAAIGNNTATGTLTHTDVDSMDAANEFTASSQTGTYGTLALLASGEWTYTLDDTAGGAADLLDETQSDTDVFTVASADGTTQDITITVQGSNDAATISGNVSEAVLETGVDAAGNVVGLATFNGTITSTDPDAIDVDNVFTPTGIVTGMYGTFALLANGNWSYTLDNTNPAVQALTTLTGLSESFDVTSFDGTPQTIGIAIGGSNDAPTLSAVNLTGIDAIIDTAGADSFADDTGTLVSADVDAGAMLTHSLVGVMGTSVDLVDNGVVYATLTLTAAGEYTVDYNDAAINALDETQSLTLTQDYQVSDGMAPPTVATLTLDINGANDAPVLTDSAGVALATMGAVTGGVTEDSAATMITTSSDIFFTDAETTDIHQVTIQNTGVGYLGTMGGGQISSATGGNVGQIQWTYTVANSAIQYLAEGETLVESFNVTIDDGPSSSFVTSIQVTVTGTNDVPVITFGGMTDSIAEAINEGDGTGAISAAGTLSVADVDVINTVDASVTALAVSGTNTFDTAQVSALQLALANAMTVTSGDIIDGVSTSGSLGWSFSSTTDLDALADGQTLVLTYTIQVEDNDGGIASQDVTITINGTNDAPVVTGGSAALLEGGTVAIDMTLLEATDVDDAAGNLTYTVTTDVVNGQLELNGMALALNSTFTQADIDAGLVTYVHDGSQNFADNVVVSVSDDGTGMNDSADVSATINFTATNVDDLPTGAVVITGTVQEDQVLTADVSAIMDAEGLTAPGFSYQWMRGDGVSAPTAIAGATSAAYTLGDADVGQIISVAVTFSDDTSVSYTLTSADTLAVVNVNDAPDGADNTITFAEDASHTFTAADFGFTDALDSVAPNALAAVIITTVPTAGSLTLNGAAVVDGQSVAAADIGMLLFTPAANANGTGYDSLTFQVVDDGGTALGGDDTDQSANTLTFDVTAVNDAPVIDEGVSDILVTGNEDTLITGTIAANDVEDGMVLTYSVEMGDGPANGAVTIDAVTGAYSYDSNDDYFGADSFTVTVTDSEGGVDTVVVGVTVDPVNDAPVIDVAASDDSGTAAEDNAISGTIVAADVDNATLTYSAVDGANGTVTIDASGAYTYTPADDFNGTDSFVVTVSDGTLSDTITVNVTIDPVNDAPVIDVAASDASVTAAEDNAISGTIVAADVDNATLTYSAVDGANGTVTIDASGAYTYTPADDFNGTDSFVVTVSDGTLSDTITVNVTVDPVNDAPTVTAPSLSIFEGETVTLTAADLGVADIDDADGNISITVSNVVGGSVSATTFTLADVAAGSVSFTHDGGETAPSFDITATDDDGAISTTEAVTITFTNINDAPDGTDSTLTVAEDGTFSFTAADFGFTDAQDTVTGPNALSAVIITALPAAGTLTLGGTPVVAGDSIAVADIGMLMFMPAQDANGTGYTSFTFQVVDDGGIANDGQNTDQTANTLTFDVTPVNDAPVIDEATSDITPMGDEDAAITGTVVASDVEDGTMLTYSIEVGGQANDGTASIDASTGEFTYMGNQDFNGSDSFTVTVTDSDGATDTVVVNVAVNAVDDAVVVDVAGVTPAVHVEAVDAVAPAPTVFAAGTVVTDVDAENFDGGVLTAAVTGGDVTDLLNFDASSSTVSVSGSDVSVSGTIVGTLAGAGSSSLSVTFNEQALAADVQAVISALTYATSDNTPAPSRDITLDLSNGDTVGAAMQQTITVAITASNDTPIATNDGNPLATTPGGIRVTEGSLATFNVVFGNTNGVTPDSDPDGDNLTVVSTADIDDATNIADSGLAVLPAVPVTLTTDQGAEVTVQSNGLVNYNLTSGDSALAFQALGVGQTLTDSFTYTVADPSGAESTATVFVTILGANDAVDAQNDMIVAAENGAGLTGNITANDEDVDTGDSFEVVNVSAGPNTTVVSDGSGGFVVTLTGGANPITIQVNSDGSYSVDVPDSLNAGETINGGFTYTVEDTGTAQSFATVTLAITGENDAPVVSAPVDLGDSTEDTVLTITSAELLANATDADSAANLTVSNLSVSSGTLFDNGDGTWDYTPAANDDTSVTFNYDVEDGIAAGVAASATLNLTPVNDAPVIDAAASDSAVSGDEDTAITGTVVASDVDIDTTLTFTAANGSNGTVAIDASTGAYTYTPAGDFNGSDSFVVTVSDGELSDTITVNVTVDPVNDAPVIDAAASDSAVSGDEDNALTGTVVASDVDIDTTLTFIAADGANGTVAIDGSTGAYTYTPAANFNGTDSFVVTVSDGNLTDTITVNVTVDPVNDAPVGDVIITGIAAEDQVLTASNTLTDNDGLGTVTYEWFAGSSSVGTGETLTLTQAEVGEVITVVASYTDNEGTSETAASDPSAAVANVNDAPVGDVTISGTAAEDAVLTASNTLSDEDGLGTVTYEWFAGSTSVGTGETLTLTQSEVGEVITVVASYTDAQGTAEAVTSAPTAAVANVNDAPVGDVTITGTAAEDAVLTASNTLSDEDGLGTVTYEWFAGSTSVGTGETLTLTQSEVGELITVVASYTDGEGTAETFASNPTVPVVNVNDAPMGGVTVDGMRVEDATLTANTAALSDEDGLGSFDYQWTRDGVNIAGATSDSYTLGDDDVNAIIEVTVSYTDDEGTSESVSSVGGTATVNVNDAPTGGVLITGLVQEDEMLTADVSAIVDADGLTGAVFSYNWTRDGVSIGAADAATYTLGDADVGAVIAVEVSYVDDNGTSEVITSADTVPVVNVNDAPIGTLLIAGTPTEDETLSLDTTFFSDADNASGLVTALDTIQWQRDGVDIAGATSGSYTLGDADVGSVITATITYTDDQGTVETLTSAATTPIANIDDAAVVTGDFTGAVTEGNIGDAPVIALGTIEIDDIDVGDNPNFPDVTSTVGDNGYGSFELSGGNWIYTLNQAAVQSLNAMEVVMDTITFTASDGTTQDITVAITGSADASVVTGVTAANVAEGELDDGNITATGTLVITNADAGSSPSFADAGPIAGSGGFGSFSIASGVWTYVATQAAVNALNVGDVVADTVVFTADDGTTQVVAVTITGANNTLMGTAAADTLVGSAGTDTILGLDGNDTLEGGADNDILDGGEGTGDTVVLSGNYADYTLSFTSGVITLTDTVGIDGTDQISNVEFLQFADQLIEVSTLGFGEINGTPGDDFINGTAGDDIINGLSGNDLINAGAGNDIVNGGSGNDNLRGDAGTDIIIGGFGADFLRGGAGADVLNGGAGADWADYTTSNGAVTVNLGTNTGLGGDAEGDTYILVERVYGSRFDDHITGDGNVNYLRGFRGDDQLFGEGGNDFLQGGLGADALDGGAGSDWAYYVSSTTGVTVDLGNVANNTGEAAGDTYTSIENVYGSRFDDHITGDAGNNFLRGNNGDDTLIGNDGDDFLRGEQGADIHDGGAGRDWAYYASSNAGIIVDLAANTASGGEAEGDSFISIERVYGSAFDDIITGDSVQNYLRGSFGDDVLNGGDGNDFLQGDAGADVLDGGAGSDWAYYISSTLATGLTINLSDSSLNTGEAIGDTYISIENILGSRFDDNITGDAGNNILRGGTGDDILNGGAGDDILRGEAGADTFVFEVGTGNDSVIDYNDAEDFLDFTAFGVADAMANAVQVGDDVVFTFGTDTVTIEDVLLIDLADNLI